jgi:exonuclease III
MFQIESGERESFRAFYQLLFWGKADATTVFTLNDREYTFYDYFEKVVTRTGEHIKTGYLYGCEKLIGKKIINTEIFNVVTQFFKLKS